MSCEEWDARALRAEAQVARVRLSISDSLDYAVDNWSGNDPSTLDAVRSVLHEALAALDGDQP